VAFLVFSPAAYDLRGQRRGGPGVHDVGGGGEAARAAPLVLAVTGRRGRGRVDRQGVRGGQNRRGVVRLGPLVERVPDRERDAEEPLAADQPVAVQAAHPVVVA